MMENFKTFTHLFKLLLSTVASLIVTFEHTAFTFLSEPISFGLTEEQKDFFLNSLEKRVTTRRIYPITFKKQN